MAVTVKRSDVFPVGTSVGLFPAAARHNDLKAVGTALASATVDAAGACGPFTPTADLPHVLYAEVAGEHRYVGVADSDFTALGTMRERIEAKQTAAGV